MKQTQTGTQPLISLQNIYKIYQMGDMVVRANDGISLDIYPGEFVSIVGKSGSGKSTIMNIIGALDVPTEGKYILNGEDVSEMKDDSLAEIRNKTIGFVFQQYNLLPKQNLLENVELPLVYAGVGKRSAQSDLWNRLNEWDCAISGATCPNSSPAASNSACPLHAPWSEILP